MWSCPFCGNHSGIKFQDSHLKGMLCMHLDCGRFDTMDQEAYEQLPDAESSAGVL